MNDLGQLEITMVRLPLRLVSEPNARGHWAKKHRRASEQRGVVRLRMMAIAGWPVRLPVRVTITRVAPRELDDDNLRGACKAVRDGVADALGVNDRDPRVEWAYAQGKGDPREYAVSIRVEVRP